MTDQEFYRISKVLADPRRFRVLQRIMGTSEEVSCQALLKEFPIAPATMSHHLKELETASDDSSYVTGIDLQVDGGLAQV